LRLLVEFVPRTSRTPVATWCWQTEGRSAERVILGVRPSGFILSEFQSPSRRIFIGSHSLPPLWSPNRSFSGSRGRRRSEISFWKKQGKAMEGMGVILTRRGTVRLLYPHQLLHHCQYVPLNCASGSVLGANPTETMCRLSIRREGEGVGAMTSGPLVSGSSQTAAHY
jgi:hypothetical protein